ncbi:unnamed protein product [Arabis nemorensis]|uniref:Uncharacterized protein n=1 Tax=Arabis nemorensis TaxID=586526 RepID=A0A565B831_9BRAS|nr:unnamed protein product [Arabis nemorensis]
MEQYREIGGKRGSSLIGDSETTGDKSNLVKTSSLGFFSVAISPETTLPIMSPNKLFPRFDVPI